ncbi:histamine H1 receptor [Sceloporus undulatus]|uniref:histamine H1 receptor n=1 Tax=Sceloporus undulatus TaxID=8520 RepID=UPI001C4D5B8C|nr:histamine H1 receptor [Sceloporus undulatus]
MCVMDRDTNKNSTQVQPVLGLVLGSISLITVVMNILVLYAVKTEKKLQTVGNLYIVSLACADVIVGAAVMPLNIVYLLKDKWVLARKACLFWLSMDYVASTASIFSLFILCIDRYRSVQQPLKYLKYRTKTRASIMISVAWSLSFLWVIPILGWRKFTHDNSTTSGADDEKICETDFCKTTWFKVLTAMINFYVPSVLMLWFYAKIYTAVRKHCQHRELINGSFKSASVRTVVHNGKPQEMQQICPQSVSKDIDCIIKENHPNKRMEASNSLSRFLKIPNVFHRGGDHEVGVVKLSCFPLEQDDMGTVNTDSKYACVNECIQNTECLCPQDYEFSRVSEEHTFADRSSSRKNSDSTQEQDCSAGNCFPQHTSRKDSTSLRYLKKTWGRLRTHSIGSQGLRGNRERKAAKQLGVIMAAFMLCWFPYFVLFMVMAYCENCYNRTVHMFTIWLGYVNSTLNPIIYPLCNENFKKAFKKIFHIKA